MKKINAIICAAAFLALMASCGGKNQFTINGSVGEGQNGKMVYIFNQDDLRTPKDSMLVADGKFTFQGTVDTAWIATLTTREAVLAELIVEPGTIVVKHESIGGTPLNDTLQAFVSSLDISSIESQMEDLFPLYYNAPDAKTRAEVEHVLDSLDMLRINLTQEACRGLYQRNGDNMLGVWAMRTMVQEGEFTYSQLDSIIGAASPLVAGDKQVQKKLAQLRAIDATSAGKHYTDIQGVDGKLSDLIDGKLALVDFYASWCGPCRNEIRDNLVPLWKKYQKKGLVIVGLNVWERGDAAARKAAHEKVMADLGITYPQLVDSTRTATDTYGVQGIPQIMLIGPDGTILARDLRGAAIEEAITKALGK